MLISDLTFNSIWKQDGSKKMFFIDEAWKVLEKPGMASLLKYLYKTIRKFDGAVGIAVQQITDIPDNALGEAIIGNSSIKYLLNHSKALSSIPKLQQRLSLNDKAISLLLSVRNNTSGKYPHSEFLLDMGSISKVLRLEVSKEAFVIYDSDKNNTNKFYELYDKYKDIEISTKKYIELYLN
jgi:type IV secretory pathway VirB4 component